MDDNRNFTSVFNRKLFDTLRRFMLFLDKYDLTWWSAFGTCLGAVRHNDIIPWDDDIDLMMPLEDYRVLLNSADQLKEFGLNVISIKDPYYYAPFLKICDNDSTIWENKKIPLVIGIYIDVFPLYNGSDTLLEFLRKRDSFHNLVYAYCKSIAHISFENILWNIIHGKIGSVKNYILWKIKEPSSHAERNKKRLIDCIKVLEQSDGPYYEIFTGSKSVEVNLFQKEWFDGYQMMKFGDLSVRVPKEYDKYLTRVFGDYMTPPPVEEQVPHHGQVYINCSKCLTLDEVLAQVKQGITRE